MNEAADDDQMKYDIQSVFQQQQLGALGRVVYHFSTRLAHTAL